MVLETATLSEVELAEYCRGKGLYVEQVRVWRAACEQANARSEQKAAEFERSLKVERRRSKQLEVELRRKEKALAEAAALLILAKSIVRSRRWRTRTSDRARGTQSDTG